MNENISITSCERDINMALKIVPSNIYLSVNLSCTIPVLFPLLLHTVPTLLRDVSLGIYSL